MKPVNAEPRSLDLLLAAKRESDRKNYALKNDILLQMVQKNPDNFFVDSDDGTPYVGLTHIPTGFRIHSPRRVGSQVTGKMPVKAAEADWLSVPYRAIAMAEKAARWKGPAPAAVFRLNLNTLAAQPSTDDRPLEDGEILLTKCADPGDTAPLAVPFQALHLTPSWGSSFSGGTTPVASMLAGSLIGAAGGWGIGRLAETMFGPKLISQRRMSTLGALLGGAGGMLPGAYLGTVGTRLNAQDGISYPARAFFQPNRWMGGKEGADQTTILNEARADLDSVLNVDTDKNSRDKWANEAGGIFAPTIPVDAFNRVIWQDSLTPVAIRAATAGLVQSASQLAGGSPWVSTWDVARIAAGMGSGLLNGVAVGKLLGALAGLSPDAQNTVQNAGLWSGALKGAIPMLFGGQ